MSESIPITIFTGFLGAGKTSVILSLLPKLPKDYKVVLLKNEFGDVAVDSQLAKQSSLAAVSEILNGCMCCVLVGQMKTALLEIQQDLKPDRIIIECSGSAFPATLAFQIRELERETSGGLRLDAIVTVIDAENFTGYEDTSPTAKMQSAYTDLLLINKWEHISERQLDIVIDHLNTLNDLTPKIRCNKRGGVDPNVIFGLDSKLFLNKNDIPASWDHHDEVETATILRKGGLDSHSCSHGGNCSHHHDATPAATAHTSDTTLATVLTPEDLEKALNTLSKDTIWRVKGFVRLSSGNQILNWAFGRYDLTPFDGEGDQEIKLTIMGERGEVRRVARKFASAIGSNVI